MTCYLTAKITNAEQLTERLGQREAGNVVRRALRRIARDARVCGGEISKITGTRVMAGFVSKSTAEQMASLIDQAIGTVPVPQGLRLQSSVIITDRDEASIWQQTQHELFRSSERAPQVSRHTLAKVSYGETELSLNKDRPELAIGRHTGNDLIVDHSKVSRRHATLSWKDGRLCLADCSSNSTYVRHADDGREVRVAGEKYVIESDASLFLGMPSGGTTDLPARIDLKFG